MKNDYEFSDEALALEFAERRRHELRYVGAQRVWLHRDGRNWKIECTEPAFDLARAIARDFASACRDPAKKAEIASARTEIASARTTAAIERLARALMPTQGGR